MIRTILDQFKTYERILNLCNKYEMDIFFKYEPIQDGTMAYHAKINDYYIYIYEDGSQIYSIKEDMRYEIYDYKDADHLFRAFMKDFFDLVINI